MSRMTWIRRRLAEWGGGRGSKSMCCHGNRDVCRGACALLSLSVSPWYHITWLTRKNSRISPPLRRILNSKFWKLRLSFGCSKMFQVPLGVRWYIFVRYNIKKKLSRVDKVKNTVGVQEYAVLVVTSLRGELQNIRRNVFELPPSAVSRWHSVGGLTIYLGFVPSLLTSGS